MRCALRRPVKHERVDYDGAAVAITHTEVVHTPGPAGDSAGVAGAVAFWLVLLAALVWLLVYRARRQRAIDAISAADEQQRRDAAQVWVKRIKSGAPLDEVKAPGIVPLPGERFFFAQQAQHGQFYKERVYSGKNPALYVPLGHGYRARLGSVSGHSAAAQNFRWDSVGTVYLSTLRLAFRVLDAPI